MTDNRTTELRAKLTERGVEWTKPNSATEFIQTMFSRDDWGIEVLERNIGLCVTATNVFDTPEQAIAATLGGANVDDALALLDEMNEQGRIEYADYSQLHDAIAATLGRGTCEYKPMWNDDDLLTGEYVGMWYTGCGDALVWNADNDECCKPPAFCPYCGGAAKAVSA